jgi:hypothetical protein
MVGFFIAYKKDEQLDKNYLIVRGYIFNTETFPQSVEIFVSYSFIENGDLQKSKSSIPFSKRNKLEFINHLLQNKSLPVVYQIGDPANSKMLFTEREIKKYKVSLDTKSLILIKKIDSINSIK